MVRRKGLAPPLAFLHLVKSQLESLLSAPTYKLFEIGGPGGCRPHFDRFKRPMRLLNCVEPEMVRVKGIAPPMAFYSSRLRAGSVATPDTHAFKLVAGPGNAPDSTRLMRPDGSLDLPTIKWGI